MNGGPYAKGAKRDCSRGELRNEPQRFRGDPDSGVGGGAGRGGGGGGEGGGE